MDNGLKKLKDLILYELNNFVVKETSKQDTYTKGKSAGLRRALVLIEDIESELSKL